MPSAQEIKKKKTKAKSEIKTEMKIPKAKTGSTRRPNETLAAKSEQIEEVRVESLEIELRNEEPSCASEDIIEVAVSESLVDEKKKLQIPNFMGLSMGAQLLKSQFPKSFGLAEKVVDDWMNKGSFNELPIEMPIVQYYVGEGFRRAKDIEQKIENKLDDAGILPIVKHQLGRAKKYMGKK
jgi:hypothetical protein